MNVLNSQQFLSLRIMLNVEKTDRNARAIAVGVNAGKSATDIAIMLDSDIEWWSRIDKMIEERLRGGVIHAFSLDDMKRMYAIVKNGAWTRADTNGNEEGARLARTLKSAQAALLTALAPHAEENVLFPMAMRGPTLVH